jgi:hypothetical protein
MPGLRKSTIEHLEEVYSNAKQQCGLKFMVPCEASEDETNILQELRWNQRRENALSIYASSSRGRPPTFFPK